MSKSNLFNRNAGDKMYRKIVSPTKTKVKYSTISPQHFALYKNFLVITFLRAAQTKNINFRKKKKKKHGKHLGILNRKINQHKFHIFFSTVGKVFQNNISMLYASNKTLRIIIIFLFS